MKGNWERQWTKIIWKVKFWGIVINKEPREKIPTSLSPVFKYNYKKWGRIHKTK